MSLTQPAGARERGRVDAAHTVNTSIAAALTTLAHRLAHGATAIADLRLLTGGASMETWAFDAVGDEVTPLILRRRPGSRAEGLPLATEAALIGRAGAVRVPVPGIVLLSAAGDDLGEAVVMTRLDGETLGARIARDARFAEARALLPAQCGAALAAIHALPTDLAPLATRGAVETLALYREIWARDPLPRAAIAAAFRWLADTIPPPVPPRVLHGDFRTGNLMVDPDQGLVGVLDWELAHLGDPAEDLGWICVNSWRFGRVDREVGGFGDLAALLAAYNAVATLPVHARRARWWQAMGSLKWATMTRTLFAEATGSVERAVIGRRLSECEADLVQLMTGAHA